MNGNHDSKATTAAATVEGYNRLYEDADITHVARGYN